MKSFKNIFIAAIFAALLSVALVWPPAVSEAAQYDTYGTTTIVAGGTNKVAALTTNTYNARIDAPKSEYVALEFSFKNMNTNGLATTFYLQRSLDGTTFEDANTYAIAVTPSNSASNSTTRLMTNINVGAFGYLRLGTVGHVNDATPITNLTVKYSIKR